MIDRYQLLADLLVGRASTEPVDSEAGWAELVALATDEGVGPLLHQALRSRPQVVLPFTVSTALASVYDQATFVGLRHAAVRDRVCQSLEKRQIPVLLMKGAALALTCYEDPVTRPMADLDLLVRPAQRKEAARCLETAGFRPRSGSLAVELRSSRSHLVGIHSPTGAMVELHWELKLLGRVQAQAVAEIWAGARPISTKDAALTMRPGHALPFLCTHMLLQHREPRLIWLYDLHRLLLQMDAAEARLAREAATRWRLGPCTALALSRVHELFGTSLPEELAGWARAMVTCRDLQARVAAQALSQGAAEAPSEYLISLVMSRNYSVRSILVPPPEELRQRLNLAADERVGVGAYARFWTHRLRNGPLHFRKFWRFWRAGSPPPCSRD